MFRSIKRQFELRKKIAIISMISLIALALVIQLISAFVLVENYSKALCATVEILFVFYIIGRIIHSFVNVGYLKNLTIGFGETRKGFTVSYILITFLSYAVALIALQLIMLIGKGIWFIRFGTMPEVLLEFGWVIYLVELTLLPFLELFIGAFMERFGMIGYWVIFGITMLFCATASRMSEMTKYVKFDSSLILVQFIVVIYLIVFIGDWILLRKTNIN